MIPNVTRTCNREWETAKRYTHIQEKVFSRKKKRKKGKKKERYWQKPRTVSS